MSTVTITLKHSKYAPWGLLTDEEKPRTIVWLTESEPTVSISSDLFSAWDLSRIQQSLLAGIIKVEGIPELEKISQETSLPKRQTQPINVSSESKVASSDFILDVQQLVKSDLEKAQILEERIKDSYPKISELISKPANELKKELKELAKKGTSVSFFQECRKREQDRKNRKSVIAVILEIIQAKINLVTITDTSSQKHLSNIYYDLIEEFEEEDIEIEVPIKR